MNKTASARFNGIGSDAVRAKTGLGWEDWLAVLDAAGAKELTHQEIVAILAKEHQVGPWWRQMVTVGYEQARGLPAKHEVKGGFQISRHKTIAAPVSVAFDAWKVKRKRNRWLANPDIEIRTAKENKSLRITWIDGNTNVEVLFADKGDGKARVGVEHSKLATAKDAERMKKYWGEQLERLKEILEKGRPER
jgi:uncharacterized protein YndB with AHSA1/START domain